MSLFKHSAAKAAAVILLLGISTFCIIHAFTYKIDQYGTKESDLVKAAGKNICMSCIGLYDENILDKIIEMFKKTNKEN